MAAMDYKTAQSLAEKLIQSGQAKGLTREALIGQIIAESQAGGRAPQSAIAAALPIEPVVLSPAKIAVPGVPFIAPKSVAPAPAPPPVEAAPMPEPAPRPAAAAPRSSEFRPMLESTLAEIAASEGAMSQAAANKQPVDIIEQARLRGLKDRARQLQDRVAAQEGAAAPEEMLAALAKREERLGRREELLKESKARSPWEALLAGGAAMAQGRRGENFGEALSRGLQAGLQDYGRSRRENVEGVESIGEARDQVVMDRYNALEKARATAVALVNSGQAIDKSIVEMANMTSKQALDAALAPFAVRKGSAEAKAAEFEAENAGRVLEAELGVKGAQAEYYRRRPGGDEPKVNVEKRADLDVLDAAAADYEAKRALYDEAMRDAKGDAKLISSDVKADFIVANAKIRQMSDRYKSKYGSTPYIGTKPTTAKPAATPVAGARKAPDGKYYVPDPKRPGKYLQVS